MEIKKQNNDYKNQNIFIEVKGLTKRFDDVIAINDLSFDIQQGEFFGFLGPNGAGKTTTINILIGLARPDSGTFRIGGFECSKNPKAAQHLLGVVPDESNLYPELTGFDNLCFCASLYGMPKQKRKNRAEELLEIFGLKEAGNRKFGGYSKGMKRKLTIAAGIIHNPSVLFLDEPTTGIDVASARQIRKLIGKLHSEGKTIFFTTHYIEEAERLCERIAFIVDGHIVKTSSIDDLLKPIRQKIAMLISVTDNSEYLVNKLASAFPQYEFSTDTSQVIRVVSMKTISIGPLVRFIEENNIEVTEARKVRPSLEDVFVKVTGVEADTMKKEKQKQGGKA